MSRKLIKYEFKQLKSALLLTAIALAVITGIIFCVVIVPMLVFGINDSAEGILSIFLAYITFYFIRRYIDCHRNRYEYIYRSQVL